jgi:(p)ppGpp synthase/HD superfamily hydrolase
MARLDRPLSARFDDALALAHRVHQRQARKGTQVPYIAHVLGVASLVLEYDGNETEATAALLHDALEDAPDDLPAHRVREIILVRFGREVLDIVEECSDTTERPKPPWRERKARYLAAAEHASESAMTVSAADKLHNLRSLIRDYRRHGETLWDRFNPEAGRSLTLGYHRALVTVYQRRLPGALADDLDRAMTELASLTGDRGVWPGLPEPG